MHPPLSVHFFYLLRLLRLLVGIGLTLLLTGCAGLNANFTCPAEPGQLCSSLDQVNRMIDQGKIGSHTSTTSSSDKSKKTASDLSSDFSSNLSVDVTPYPMTTPKTGEPLRYNESVLRIWLAAYEDKAGNYYPPSFAYTVVRPGHWVGQPVQAVTNDD